jgi:hypothetical protein
MGYQTDFSGEFKLNKLLDEKTFTFLTKLSETRRVKRNVHSKYGVEGEFYVDGEIEPSLAKVRDPSIIDITSPPRTQPNLWCDWAPVHRDGYDTIEWNGTEKSFDYVKWIEYIANKILAPKGYILDGEVEWRGENRGDTGTISIVDNVVGVET